MTAVVLYSLCLAVWIWASFYANQDAIYETIYRTKRRLRRRMDIIIRRSLLNLGLWLKNWEVPSDTGSFSMSKERASAPMEAILDEERGIGDVVDIDLRSFGLCQRSVCVNRSMRCAMGYCRICCCRDHDHYSAQFEGAEGS